MRARLLLPMLLAGTLGLTASANAQFKPSVNQQIELGQDAKKQVEEEYEVLPASDPRVRELRSIGNKLVAQISKEEMAKRPWQFSFDVIESEEINAFALPGGPIYFFTGMLEQLETTDQLAGILAHEITHVRNQHWASRYADNQKRRLGIFVLLSVIGAGNTAFDIASVGDALFTLDYSRRHETESDEKGFDLMVLAGYNPQGMADVFRMLDKKGSGGDMEFLSTHPDAGKRATRIEERIQKAGKTYPPQTPRSPGGDVLEQEREAAGLLRKRKDPPATILALLWTPAPLPALR